MRRNWDTIRTVLFAVEQGFVGKDGRFADDAHLAHFRMLREGRFLLMNFDGPALTHVGCDLLDAIRDEEVWVLLQAAIAGNAGGMPADLLLYLARAIIEVRGRGLLGA